jgi:predicted RNA-binding protein with PUA domain
MLRQKFRKHKWEEGESFNDYIHDKIILGNRVPVVKDELVEYIIDGISDGALKNQARVGDFGIKALLMALYEQVEL